MIDKKKERQPERIIDRQTKRWTKQIKKDNEPRLKTAIKSNKRKQRQIKVRHKEVRKTNRKKDRETKPKTYICYCRNSRLF